MRPLIKNYAATSFYADDWVGTVRGHLLWVVAIAAVLATPIGASASAPPTFPVADATLYPSADNGRPPGFTSNEQLMRASAGTSGQAVFMPVLGILGAGVNEQSWLSESLSGATYRFPEDALATISFAPLNVEAVASFTVELHSSDARGHDTLLGTASRTFNLPRLLPTDETFQVPIAGRILERSDALRLVLRADSLDVLTIVEYGAGTATKVRIAYQILDTDGDGIPDDADGCPLEADCNGDGTADGDQNTNSTTHQTVFQYFQNYYNGTAGTGGPGMPGAPGSPGAPGTPAPIPTLDGGPNPGPGSGPGPAAQGRDLGRIEATAGGFALATGSTITSLALLRRRP